MRATTPFIVTAAIIAFVVGHGIAAQAPAEIWRTFAETVEVGTEMNVRLNDGRRIRATLVSVRDDAVLLLPKTRVPVPIQAVPYEAIVRLERAPHGVGAAKAVAIGAVTGAGAFFAMLAILLAVAAD